MARHSEATGYLIELRDREVISWFTIICDLAISAKNATLTDKEIKNIMQVFLGNITYQPQTATPVTILNPVIGEQSQPTSTTLLFLEKLSEFTNFKQLSSTLELVLDKRITIIFGMNGAGKSSLSEAIKVLAQPQEPEKPLNNVKDIDANPTSFNYKFNIDSSESSWHISNGYGAFSDRIKYFDSTVAFKYLRDPASPESVVSIEPFRLEVFQYSGIFVRLLNQALDNIVNETKTKMSPIIEKTQTVFSEFIEREMAIEDLSLTNCDELKQQLESHKPLGENEEKILEDSKTQLDRLKSATSEEGLRLQKDEFDILLQYSRSIKAFKRLFNKGSLRETDELFQRLNELKSHQSELAKSITPDDIDKANFVLFIQDSQQLLDYEAITEEINCPFCQRPFDQDALDLCNKYHEFLLDKVGEEIPIIEEKLKTANENIQAVKSFPLKEIESSRFPTLQAILDDIGGWVGNIQSCIPDTNSRIDVSKFETYENNELLESIISQLAKEILSRYRSIKIATGDTKKLQTEISTLSEIIRKYDYQNLIESNKNTLEQLVISIEELNNLKTLIDEASFSAILGKITNKHKDAYSELVVEEFENKLNDEYELLSGKNVSDFGIQLLETGADQNVKLNANIGGIEIHRVLSEGEQKIHALALFYAEASVGDHHIIIFDDPVTSFDYDYSEQYARRLRDFALSYPDRQIIVLTHNWDFFVHIQTILNKANLNNDFSVQVIEQCSIVKEYREDIDALKDIITPKLQETGVISFEDKVLISAIMRRLIEAIVNRYVFNNQRHQFKQKSMNVSNFHAFMRIVPLEQTEVNILADTYSHLSVPEHDDPRNHYRNVERMNFSNWFDEICTIETNLISRRP